jgi:hypothetical protein
MSPEQLAITTSWKMNNCTDEGFSCVQEIELVEVNDIMKNSFTVTFTENNKFNITLQNEILGLVEGTGFYDENVIAWEFRGSDLEFEGYELYEKQKDGSYLSRAEYASKEQMRTIIEGTIHKK